MTTTWVLSADVNLLAGQAVTGIAKIEAVGVNPGGVTVPIPAIRDTVDNHIWSGPQRIKLIDGQLMTTLEDPVVLPDSTGTDPGFSPAAWSYRVTLQLDHLQKQDYPVYVFQLGEDTDLADVVSVPPATDPLDNPWQDAVVQTAADVVAAEAARVAAEAARDLAQAVPTTTDTIVNTLLGNPATASRGALDALYDRAGESYRLAAKHGVDVTGATDAGAAYVTEVGNAAADARPLLVSGTVKSTGVVTVNAQSIRVKGTPGSKFNIAHANMGHDYRPTTTSVGSVAATTAGATTVDVVGGGMTVNAHAGKWLEVTDPAINPLSGDLTIHARRIVSNTATTLTLEHAIGYPIPATNTAVVIVPLDEVRLTDVTIDRTVAGSANLVIRYAKSVILDNVTILNAGNYATSTGNGLALYHCDRVRGTVITRNSGGFGAFIYNCDDVQLDYRAFGWGGQFGVQVKDCRNAVVRPYCVADGVKGDTGFNQKCSGLNPSYNVVGVDGYTANSKTTAYESSSITAEGTIFAASDHKLIRCRSVAATIAGFTTIQDAGSLALGVRGLAWRECSAVDGAQLGFTATTPMLIQDCRASRNGFEGISVAANDVVVRGGRMTDNVQAYVSGATRSSEILIGATTLRTFIDGVTFERTTAGKSIRAVREVAGAAATVILNPRIIHPAATGYTTDFVFSGAGSKAVGDPALDTYGGTLPTVVKKLDPALRGSASLNFPSIPATGGTADLTVPVVGAVVGDEVRLGPPTTLNAGLVPYGFVSAADVVTIRVTNMTAAAIDPAAATWKVAVSKA